MANVHVNWKQVSTYQCNAHTDLVFFKACKNLISSLRERTRLTIVNSAFRSSSLNTVQENYETQTQGGLHSVERRTRSWTHSNNNRLQMNLLNWDINVQYKLAWVFHYRRGKRRRCDIAIAADRLDEMLANHRAHISLSFSLLPFVIHSWRGGAVSCRGEAKQARMW